MLFNTFLCGAIRFEQIEKIQKSFQIEVFFNKVIIKCLKPLVTKKKQNYENIARLKEAFIEMQIELKFR